MCVCEGEKEKVRASMCESVWVDGLMPSIRVLLQLKIAMSIRVRRAWPVTIETRFTFALACVVQECQAV